MIDCTFVTRMFRKGYLSFIGKNGCKMRFSIIADTLKSNLKFPNKQACLCFFIVEMPMKTFSVSTPQHACAEAIHVCMSVSHTLSINLEHAVF